jgi:hypothetical protein
VSAVASDTVEAPSPRPVGPEAGHAAAADAATEARLAAVEASLTRLDGLIARFDGPAAHSVEAQIDLLYKSLASSSRAARGAHSRLHSQLEELATLRAQDARSAQAALAEIRQEVLENARITRVIQDRLESETRTSPGEETTRDDWKPSARDKKRKPPTAGKKHRG